MKKKKKRIRNSHHSSAVRQVLHTYISRSVTVLKGFIEFKKKKKSIKISHIPRRKHSFSELYNKKNVLYCVTRECGATNRNINAIPGAKAPAKDTRSQRPHSE